MVGSSTLWGSGMSEEFSDNTSRRRCSRVLIDEFVGYNGSITFEKRDSA